MRLIFYPDAWDEYLECAARGRASADAAAAPSNRPIPSFSARLQSVADMVSRWGCRPGVPAITNRNGASDDATCLAFSSARPTSLIPAGGPSRHPAGHHGSTCLGLEGNPPPRIAPTALWIQPIEER